MVTYGRHHICYIKLIPFCVETPVICRRLRDVIMLVYAAHAFYDNILYFCSKINKKLYIIGNVYDNIKSSSEGGCRLIQKRNVTMTTLYPHNTISYTYKHALFSLPLISPSASPLSLSFLYPFFPPSTPSLHHQNNVC